MRAGKQVRIPDWPVPPGESMPSPSNGNLVPRRLPFAAKTGLDLASSAADPGSKTNYSRLHDGGEAHSKGKWHLGNRKPDAASMAPSTSS